MFKSYKFGGEDLHMIWGSLHLRFELTSGTVPRLRIRFAQIDCNEFQTKYDSFAMFREIKSNKYILKKTKCRRMALLQPAQRRYVKSNLCTARKEGSRLVQSTCSLVELVAVSWALRRAATARSARKVNHRTALVNMDTTEFHESVGKANAFFLMSQGSALVVQLSQKKGPNVADTVASNTAHA